MFHVDKKKVGMTLPDSMIQQDMSSFQCKPFDPRHFEHPPDNKIRLNNCQLDERVLSRYNTFLDHKQYIHLLSGDLFDFHIFRLDKESNPILFLQDNNYHVDRDDKKKESNKLHNNVLEDKYHI